MKDAGIHIRVEKDLREVFVSGCQPKDGGHLMRQVIVKNNTKWRA